MLFNSFAFIFLFLPVALAGYYGLGLIRARLAIVWLVIASFLFYAWWDSTFVLLLLGSIVVNFLVGMTLLRLEERPRAQFLLTVIGVGGNIGLLFYFKYLFPLMNFFRDLLLQDPSVASVILPLGISFFTFTQIGFLLDCKAGTIKARGPVSYLLFVTFFPHLIAGPILHHREMMPQFAEPETTRFRSENLSIGFTIFVIGLAKKVLLADGIAPYAQSGFAVPHDLQFFGAWSAAVSYTLQLYFDFSGYSDMALGLAKMFGVRFPLNFNAPLKATSIIGFWQAWHMTLTRYLNLYLYNPVALAITRRRAARGLPVGKKAAATPAGFLTMVLVPTIFTMGLAGAWHGAGLQFVIFGLLHGAYLVINNGWRTWRGSRGVRGGASDGGLARAGWVGLTFLAVVVSMVYFRAASVPDAHRILAAMVGLHGVEAIGWFPLDAAAGQVESVWQFLRLLVGRWLHPLQIVLLLAIAWTLPSVHQFMGRWSPALERPQASAIGWLQWRPSPLWGAVTCALFFYCLLYLNRKAEFLYFQF